MFYALGWHVGAELLPARSQQVGLLKIVVLNFGGSLLKILYSYLQAGLTWKWRWKLTDHLHSLYFKNKAYYFIGEGGA